MVSFDEWSNTNPEEVNGHRLRLLTLKAGQKVVAEDKVVAVVPHQYASVGRYARILEKQGNVAAAKYLRNKLPTKQKSRSGDLGEILATQYVVERMNFCVLINKLRWRDHREVAMRGEDLIGVRLPENGGSIHILKGEAKSRASLRMDTVNDARAALDRDGGLPSPHALTFVADRLFEMEQKFLSDAIDTAQLNDAIITEQMEHLIFTFSGNNPDNALRTDLENYEGTIPQNNVGLKIGTHQEFIEHVFEKASDI